jgi:hypothetical protein
MRMSSASSKALRFSTRTSAGRTGLFWIIPFVDNVGQAEVEIAHSFETAAQSYRDNPTALHLRAMNMLYEGLKEKGALMLVPSSAVESMGMGGLLGAAALRQQTLTGSDEVPE